MNNRFNLFLVVFLFVWAASFPLSASAQQKEGYGKSRPGSRHADDGKAVISETGEAKEYFRPDIAIITLGVETKEKTASRAVEENAEKAKSIITSLKGLIKSAAGDSIKTSSFTLQPVYEYDAALKKNLLEGYMVRNLVTVRTKETDMAGRIIDEAVRSGANTVQGLNFTLSDEKEFCEGVLKKAAEKAKKEAAYVASLLGTEISGVKSISSSCGSETPHPVYGGVLAAKAAVPETVIESGDIAVMASVSVVFRLKQGRPR